MLKTRKIRSLASLLCYRCKPSKHTFSMTKRLKSTDSSLRNEERVADFSSMRNLAIIAHVDHGKTTLVDSLLKTCGAIESNDSERNEERVMDSMDQEKERGITISSKITGMTWKGIQLNIVDTPGHADFGGEVERVLSLVDGVVIVVDASDGPNTQTRYVTSKALERGLQPLIVVNKVDRDTADIVKTENEVFDLFISLNANDDQLEAPFVYASARSGWAVDPTAEDYEEIEVGKDLEGGSMAPLLDAILTHLPDPSVSSSDENEIKASCRFLVSMMSHDKYLGRLVTGKIEGRHGFKLGDEIRVLKRDGELGCTGKITKILSAKGTDTEELESGSAGSIVTIAGIPDAHVTDTLILKREEDDDEIAIPVDTPPIDPATVAMTFASNSSPMAGRDGTKLNSSQLDARLKSETLNNVSINVLPGSVDGTFEVRGRGDLQLGVLIESLRREGFEMEISPPRVLDRKTDDKSKREEPYELLQIDVEEEHCGVVMEKLNARKGQMMDMSTTDDGRTRLEYVIPARALLGYRVAFQHDTHGSGVMNKTFHKWDVYAGDIPHVRTKGALISTVSGKSTAYTLASLEARGKLFVKPAQELYEGMIIGEHSRDNDLAVNPCKGKQLTNMRTSGSDEAVALTPPRVFTLEEALGYLKPDELLEITPNTFRMRKVVLNADERTRLARNRKGRGG